MIAGKLQRLHKLLDPADGRSVTVAADHGWMSDMTENVVQLERIVRQVAAGGADGILMSMGQARHLGHLLHGRRAPALLVRADWMNLPRLGGANETNAIPVSQLKRVAAATAADALRLGASGITIYFFVGYDDGLEGDNVESCATFVSECRRIGLPCVIEPIALGARVNGTNQAPLLIAAARIAAEIGADALKIPYTGDPESMRLLVQAAGGVPVLMLGGAKSDNDRDALEMVEEGLKAGVSGVVFGRNVTKAKDPEWMVRSIGRIVHGGETADDIYRVALAPEAKLRAIPRNCSGCRACELACNFHRHLAFQTTERRIWIEERFTGDQLDGRFAYTPHICTKCELCIKACPTGAFRMDPKGFLALDESLCNGCNKCVEVCPTRVIALDERHIPVFCDLCQGDPQCVKACGYGALVVTGQLSDGGGK
ncbi:MAG: 4Fe-4S dicluster domain-containing protein [Mycobacterium leprae]